MSRFATAAVPPARPAEIVRPFAAPAIEPPLPAARVDGEVAQRFAAAEAAGHAAGYAAGRGAAETARAEHAAAAAALTAAAAAFTAARGDLASADRLAVEALEREIVALAVELAADLVGRHLPDAEAQVLDTLHRAAPLVADRPAAVIRVHPAVAAAARAHLADEADTWRAAELVGDASLAPGECLVDAGACRIDAQLSSAVARLRAALG